MIPLTVLETLAAPVNLLVVTTGVIGLVVAATPAAVLVTSLLNTKLTLGRPVAKIPDPDADEEPLPVGYGATTVVGGRATTVAVETFRRTVL
jgi:hypothetical protein